LDEVEKAILLRLGSETRTMISEIEESGLAARQTIHTRVERLLDQGYLQEEREQKLPFRRHLSLTEKGRGALSFELSRDRAELEERAEGEEVEDTVYYGTGWLFRDFVHRDLSPRESVVRGALRFAGTLGIVPAYREIFQPAFRPNEAERDYAELLMRLLVDSVDHEGLLEGDGRLKAFARIHPAYRRTIARGYWSVATGLKGQHFDYLSAFDLAGVQRLVKKPFVEMLERNYLQPLNEECSRAAGEHVALDGADFLKMLCWMRLKQRSLSLRAYERLREPLLLVALSDLGIIEKERAAEKLTTYDSKD